MVYCDGTLTNLFVNLCLSSRVRGWIFQEIVECERKEAGSLRKSADVRRMLTSEAPYGLVSCYQEGYHVVDDTFILRNLVCYHPLGLGGLLSSSPLS